MKKIKNQIGNNIRTSILISLFLHLAVLLIFAIIEFGNVPGRALEYSTIEFSETPASTLQKIIIKKKKHFTAGEKEVEKYDTMNQVASLNSAGAKKDSVNTASFDSVSNKEYLKFAETLLDTFLIRYPQYASMVLKQHAKALASKSFTRETLINRINDGLHKYIRRNFPEGSEHEINPYTGPGIQIPIDDLINIVKKIF